MNKQSHVHSVNQWVACRKESSRCRAHWSIGSIEYTQPRLAVCARGRGELTRAQNRMAHTRRGRRASVCVRKGFPTAPRPRSCRPPQTCCAATGVTPHSYRLDMPAPRRTARAHAHHNITFQYLIIVAHHSWNCRAPRPLSSTSFINLISSITGCAKVKYLTGSIYSPPLWMQPDTWHHVMLIQWAGAIVQVYISFQVPIWYIVALKIWSTHNSPICMYV